MRSFREVMGSQLLTSPRVCQNSCRVDELSCLLQEMSPSWRHNRRCHDPGKGGVGCTSTCPRCAPKASGRKEASYCSILDRLQEKSSHCLATHEILGKFLSYGKILVYFNPIDKCYKNICYLSTTRIKVNMDCCNRFIKENNKRQFIVDFTYDNKKET